MCKGMSEVYEDPTDQIQDPNVLRAVSSLLSTDVSASHKEDVVDALSEVQDACEADVVARCTVAQPMFFQDVQSMDNLDGILGGIFENFMADDRLSSTPFLSLSSSSSMSQPQAFVVEFGRRLTAIDSQSEKSEGLRLLNSLTSKVVTPLLKLIPVSQKIPSRDLSMPRRSQSAVRKNVVAPKSASVAGRRQLQRGPGPKPPPRGMAGPPPRPEDENSDSDSEDEDHGPPRRVRPDDLYKGALGYETNTDMCLYSNFKSLQPQCQNAIAQVYLMRQDYWRETQEIQTPPHHHGFPWLMLLIPLFMVFAIRRRMKQVAVWKTMDAIHANPEMKAKLEAITGVKVPERSPCCKKGGQSKCCTVLGAIGTVVGILVASFFIAASSLVIATGIVSSMSYIDASGADVHPSAPVAILVLLLVTGIEVVMFIGVLRGCKLIFSPSPFPAADSSVPSAPYEIADSTLSQPLVSPQSNSSSGGGNDSGSPRYRSFFARVAGVTRRLPHLLSTSYYPSSFGNGTAYSALPSGEEQSDYVEMSTVTGTSGSTPYAMAPYPGSVSVPLPIQAAATYTPMTVPASHVVGPQMTIV